MRRAIVLVPILLIVLIALFFALRPSPPAPEDSADTSESPSESTDGGQQNTIDVAIAGGAMTPNEISVNEGDAVNLRITSDEPLEFHLHGYDLEEEIEPGEPQELAFDATITGRFEIENEEAQEELGALLVQPS